MNKKNYPVLENLVLAAIFLVLIQTFLEDFAVIGGWSWDVRKVLILSGFVFDLFFTIEFFTRLYQAILRGDIREYLVLRRGWIDLLASVPLLMLNSGPSAIAVLLGGGAITGAGGILNVLKVVKAVRIARILRLMRILKIFKQIKNTDSEMAQRHISRITTTGVTVFVAVLLVSSVAGQIFSFPSAAENNENHMIDTMMAYADDGSVAPDMYSDLLIVKKNGTTVYTKHDNDYYSRNFGYGDYQYAEYLDYEFFFDVRQVERVQSTENLVYFLMIIVLVASYSVFYSPHFAMTVSDPIHVMRRGLEEKTYNYAVKIDPDYSEDDVFMLAEQYNNVFLPMKDRNLAEDDQIDADSLELKIDDIKSLL